MNKNIQKYVIAGAVIIFISALLLSNSDGFAFWFKFWWMFPTALVIATIVNTSGISGAALFVPFFILVFPFFADPLTPLQSVKLGLITESFGLTSSALAFWAFGLIDKKIAWYAIVGAVPFVVGGAVISSFLPQTALYLMIAALLISAVVLFNAREVLHKKHQEEKDKQKIDLTVPEGEKVKIKSADKVTYRYCRTKQGYTKRFFGYGIGGFFQGAAGFGIGELGIISMISTRIPIRISIGTSHIIVASTAIMATITHILLTSAASASIPWNIPFMTVPAVVIGGQIAPYVAAKLPTKILSMFISTLFIIIAVLLILLVITQR